MRPHAARSGSSWSSRSALRTRELHADSPGRPLSRAAPALATLGLAAYAAYLYQRFGNPIAFITTQSHWGHSLNGSTLLKVPLLHELARIRTPYDVVRYAFAPTVTLIALALVPRVFRRLGAAYGWYALLIIALPALTTGDLFSMGRFLLPSFPCLAVGAELLAGKRRLRFATLTLTVLTGVVVTMLLAQGNYLA